MSTSTTSGRGDAAGTTSRREGSRPVRLSTETKQAFKTTEFVAMVAVIVGILVAAALVKGGDSNGQDEFIARQAWLYVSIVAGAYLISRGLAKSGSREAYWSDGTNSDRGDDHR